MMLTELEKKEITSEISLAMDKKAAIIDVLRVVQKHRGWVPDEAVEEIALLLDMTPAEVDSVATFYSLIFRKPVGRHVILLCDSMSCWLTGSEEIKNHLMEQLGIVMGETTPDGNFTLLPSACLGLCEEAPAMMIDEKIYTRLTPAVIDGILKRYQP
jgi:NADH-quinone oxidoreductase subunit E